MQIMSSDLYESTFLHCCGARLVDLFMDRSSVKPTVVFTFQGSEALQQLQVEYHTGNALINAADYRRSMIALKKLMFDLMDGRTSRKQTQSAYAQVATADKENRRDKNNENSIRTPALRS